MGAPSFFAVPFLVIPEGDEELLLVLPPLGAWGSVLNYRNSLLHSFGFFCFQSPLWYRELKIRGMTVVASA